MQNWVFNNTHTNFGALPYGVGEVRYLLDGSYMVGGVKLKKVPGDTLRKKVEHVVSQQGLRQFLELADGEHGFWCVHDAINSCLVIPPGYMVAESGRFSNEKMDADGAHGVCWGFLDLKSKAVIEQCMLDVPQMMETYPALRASGYSSWHDCLRTYLLPSAGE